MAMDEDFRKAALDYHRLPRPGKLAIEPTKRMATQRDLALAYSPGVAAACEAIVADPDAARDLTARGNLVAVITNGTAVLGLGNIGPLAGKPVMEGKAVLFKKFAGIDVFDLEVATTEIERFVDVVSALEPTFGGINLEDIKAPECFVIERALRQKMNIPVFHDDQHGTAIVCAAAIPNGLVLQGKKLEEIKLVTSGAGAAALACVDLLVEMGLPVANVTLTDIKGVVHADRGDEMAPNMARYAHKTDARTPPEVMGGAGVFLGLSAPRVLKAEWLSLLAPRPIILALANPEPEIRPDVAVAARPDAIVATGRSDFPNQVNNVLCFPFVFRGALDVGATEINEPMKRAAAEAIAELARVEANEGVAQAYGGAAPVFGPQYIIPKPFDPRLILKIAPAVARAAMDSGVARRPIADFVAYQRELELFVYRSGQLMRPVFAVARSIPQRVVYAEGEDDRVLRAVQSVVDEKLAQPVLIGRRSFITQRVKELGLRLEVGGNMRVVDPNEDTELMLHLIKRYQSLVDRKGVPLEAAERRVMRRPTITAAMMLEAGEVDAALVGSRDDWGRHMTHVMPIIAKREDVSRIYALSSLILQHPALFFCSTHITAKRGDVTRIYALPSLILQNGALFFCDTHVNIDPTAEQVAEMTLLAADAVRRFGLTPKAALLSHSSFGASRSPSARKMRPALKLIRKQAPEREVDAEMQADTALSEALRHRLVSHSPLTGSANLLVMPPLDAANIAMTLLSAATEALLVGPLLLGISKPLQVLVPRVTARGIVNMTALAVAHANTNAREQAPARP